MGHLISLFSEFSASTRDTVRRSSTDGSIVPYRSRIEVGLNKYHLRQQGPPEYILQWDGNQGDQAPSAC